MGFASLLRLESHQLMRTLSLWLVERFDPHRRRLDLGERGIIPISPYDVGLVLGIPVGGDDVPINGRDSDVRSIRVEFSSNHGIDVSTLEVKLAERDAGPSFKRAFLLFALGTLLCPTRGLKVSPRFLHAVYHIEQVHRYNWAGLVLNCLANAITVFKSAGEEHTRDGLGGCLLFLYMFYLDRIDSGRAPPRHILPRVAAWTAGDLSAAAEVDRQGTGVYGACPVILVTRSEPTPTLVQETPHWDDLVRGMGIDPFGVPVADYIDEFRQVVAQAAYRLSQQVIHKAMNRGYPYISPAGRVPYNPCNPPDQTTATPGAHPANVVPPPHDDPSAPTTSSHSSQTSMQEDLNTSSIAYLHRRRHQHFKRPAIQIALNSNNASAIDSATIDVDASSTARTLTIGAPIDVNSINPNIAANPNANANGIAQFADPTAAHDPVSPPNPIPLHTALMMVPNNASRRPRHRAR
ncbi:uncharacterized protein LOC131159157 isoform X1 [Malania oleifera]|uniref:uncharacterized protein LOC131159157 isoform X1 n=1 Tax=Malania oleifera TaxID=397392 RepID=UPI0025AEC7AF|nr:uncharacterized protein LOC131159157 isoform X1 [Malania oleifera]